MGSTEGRSKLFEAYATAHEEDGVWVKLREFADDTPPIMVCVRSMNSKRARHVLTAQLRAQRAKLTAQNFITTPEQDDANEIELCVKALVADWKGIEENGVPLPCTAENIERLMTVLPAFRRDVVLAARMDETFRASALTAVEGNSQPPSASS